MKTGNAIRKKKDIDIYCRSFRDNNSCIRRDIFEKYPYKDVSFAEDQIWAKQMIELGYKKLYCPFAPVYHSHNYKLSTYFMRYYDEYKGLYYLQNYQIAKSWTRLSIDDCEAYDIRCEISPASGNE